MKTLFFTVAIFCSQLIYAQKEVRSTLKTSSLGWKIEQVIQNDSDTMVYFYMGFQNMNYQYITDIWSLYFVSQSELNEFATKLAQFSLLGKENVSETIGNYTLKTYDFTNSIYISDEEDKYTIIPKKKAAKLAEEMKNNSIYLRK